MSPGPSLALVLSRTLSGGRGAGARVALGHGLGVGLYAGLAVGGVAVVLETAPALFRGLQLVGAAFLVWMGVGLLRAAWRPADDGGGESAPASAGQDWRDGFLLAFLNPKIGVFFLALFAQLVDPGASAAERVGMAVMAGGIDTGWYLVVALLIGGPGLSAALARRQRWLDGGMGLLLIVLAVVVAAGA